MSLRATISRKLIIKSPIELLDILISEKLNEDDMFKNICFLTGEYLKGCRCIKDPYYDLMLSEYNRISEDVNSLMRLSSRIKSEISIIKVENLTEI